jgi:hypothetical protein
MLYGSIPSSMGGLTALSSLYVRERVRACATLAFVCTKLPTVSGCKQLPQLESAQRPYPDQPGQLDANDRSDVRPCTFFVTVLNS